MNEPIGSLSRNQLVTTAHPQCHSTNISACGVWEVRVGVQVFIREFHTHTFRLGYIRNFYLVKKKKKKKNQPVGSEGWNSLVNIHPYLFPLVDDCRSLFLRIPSYEIQHAFREANKCVDVLAAFGRSQDQDFVVFVYTPAMAREFIVIDKSAVTNSRLVVVSQLLYISIFTTQKKKKSLKGRLIINDLS